MSIYGLGYVEVQTTSTKSVDRNVSVNTVPSLEESGSSTNMFVQNNPTNEEIITYYQSLRNQQMDHAVAWGKVTLKYNWDADTSESKLTEITEFIKSKKQDSGDTASSEGNSTKKNRQL